MIVKKGSNKEFWTEERCFITEILNNPKLEGLSLAQARVKAQVTTQAHALDCDELYYILSGNGILHLDAVDYPLQVGDTAWIKKGQNQSITNASPENDLVFLCICTPPFEIDSYTALE